jgi:hypothetical protein
MAQFFGVKKCGIRHVHQAKVAFTCDHHLLHPACAAKRVCTVCEPRSRVGGRWHVPAPAQMTSIFASGRCVMPGWARSFWSFTAIWRPFVGLPPGAAPPA